MSPAPLAADSQPDQQLKILARAFEALLLTTQQLSSKDKLLQERLKYAHDEYLKLADRLPGGLDTRTKVVSEKILGRHYEHVSPPKQTLNPLDVVKTLEESGNVGDSSLDAITAGLECYKTILNHDDRESSDANTGVVATRAGSLEKDFTTKGTRGSLRCPFTKPHNVSSGNGVTNAIETAPPAQNGDTCGFGNLDPIKTGQLDIRSSQAASARTSTTRCPISRCPIRFLDRHSPEEIADYVERHKHEIPRSHAICVKRYQNSSRQLDAKYGDLTNMIRGLSMKHQPFLPGHDRSVGTATSSVERVEKWAEEVKLKSDVPTPAEEEELENDDDRKGHFDRPLREIRVGESPSRPWGIHVPVPLPPAASESAPKSPAPDLTDKPSEEKSVPRKTGRCPFGHGAGAPPADHPAIETETVGNEPVADKTDAADMKEERQDAQNAPCPPKTPTAHVVFNGPVFFGFSPEQTAAFMQQLAGLGVNKS